QIAGLSPPAAHRGDDATAWGLEKDGRFRIRSAYDLLGEHEGRRRDVDWELVWRWKGPNRIKHFLWLVAHDRLLTNEERRKRTWTEDGSCSRCGHPQETVLHVLRDCSAAVNTWTHLAFRSDDRTSWDLPLLPWITHHLKAPSTCLLFGVACWSLWKTRNEAIFTDIRTTPEALSYRIRHWTSTVGEALILVDQFITPSPPAKTVVDVSWMPPPPEWVTLNSDGFVIPETGRAAAGGLFRDADGRCLAAFSMNLRICSITRAELRGAMIGLQIAWDRGFRRIIVQLDSRVAVQLLLGDGEDSHQHSSEIASFREMLDRDWMIKVEHIYREGNRTADYLAGIGHALTIGVHDVSSFDPCLSHHLLYDLLGISQTHLVMNER
ncbi:Putative ribonuclease H protein At1g65750, partial [Linum perenne]